jgi:hypothetical protein
MKQEVFNTDALLSVNYEIARFFMIVDKPKTFDKIFGMAPISLGIEIAHFKFCL